MINCTWLNSSDESIDITHKANGENEKTLVVKAKK
jgi:hypothetical protein